MVLSIRIVTALKSLWDSNSLGDTFAGGIWAGRAPSNTSFPYVEVTDRGSPVVMRGSHKKHSQPGLRMVVRWKEDNATDPLIKLQSLAGALTAVFDDPALLVPTSAGNVLYFALEDDPQWSREEEGVWMIVLNYRALAAAPVDWN